MISVREKFSIFHTHTTLKVVACGSLRLLGHSLLGCSGSVFFQVIKTRGNEANQRISKEQDWVQPMFFFFFFSSLRISFLPSIVGGEKSSFSFGTYFPSKSGSAPRCCTHARSWFSGIHRSRAQQHAHSLLFFFFLNWSVIGIDFFKLLNKFKTHKT